MERVIKDELKRIFIEYNPNFLRFEDIKRKIDLPEEQLHDYLDELVEEEFLSPPDPYPVGGEIFKLFRIKDTDKYPIKYFIKVGDIHFPRILDGGKGCAEDWNRLTEYFAKYDKELSVKYKKTFEEQIRNYWISIISIFGVFSAIISFIFISANSFSSLMCNTFWGAFSQAIGIILPISIIIILLLIAIKKIFIK